MLFDGLPPSGLHLAALHVAAGGGLLLAGVCGGLDAAAPYHGAKHGSAHSARSGNTAAKTAIATAAPETAAKKT